MIKFVPVLLLAVVACVLTAFSAFSEQARLTTILFRSAISLVVFGLLGTVLALFFKRSFGAFFSGPEEIGKRVDIVQKPHSDELEENNLNPSFKPLSSEQLEHISESNG